MKVAAGPEINSMSALQSRMRQVISAINSADTEQFLSIGPSDDVDNAIEDVDDQNTVLIFRPGNYHLAGNPAMDILNRTRITLWFMPGATIMTEGAGHGIDINGGSEITLIGLNLDGVGNADGQTAIWVRNEAADIRFINTRFWNWPAGPCITLRECDRVTVDDAWSLDTPNSSGFMNIFGGQGVILNNCHMRPATITGSHTGANNQLTVMTDSTKAWAVDALAGQIITNITKNVIGTITSNTANTATCTAGLTGGADWDTGDTYIIRANCDQHIDIKALDRDVGDIHISNVSATDCVDLIGIGTEMGNGTVIENVTVVNGTTRRCTYPVYIKAYKYDAGYTQGIVRGVSMKNIVFEDALGAKLLNGLKIMSEDDHSGLADVYGLDIQMRGRGCFASPAGGSSTAFWIGNVSKSKLDLAFESVNGTNDLSAVMAFRGLARDLDITVQSTGFAAGKGIDAYDTECDIDDIFIHDFNLKTVPAGTTWMETQAGATVGTIYLRRGFVPVGAIRTIGPGTINQHDVINSLTEVKGRATLVAGTVTVNNANAAAARDIEAFAIDNNTTGALRISAVVDGVSFTITSSNLLDTGVVAWEIKEP